MKYNKHGIKSSDFGQGLEEINKHHGKKKKEKAQLMFLIYLEYSWTVIIIQQDLL